MWAWRNNKSHVNRNGLLTSTYLRESVSRKGYWAVPKGSVAWFGRPFVLSKFLKINNMKEMLTMFSKALGWIFGIIFLMGSFIYLSEGNIPEGIGALLAGCLFLPPSFIFLRDKTPNFKFKNIFIICLGILLGTISILSGWSPHSVARREAQMRYEAEQNAAEILAKQEKQKIKEEEEKAKAQAEEEKRNTQAEKYCSERKNNQRKFPVVDEALIKNENNRMQISYKEIKQKSGSQLTKEDCRKIVDFMYKWGIKEVDDIIGRKYWVGMNSVGLDLSLSLPDDINTDNYGNGEREQRIYKKDSYGINAMYFYVEDGKVTAYQDF